MIYPTQEEIQSMYEDYIQNNPEGQKMTIKEFEEF